MESCWGLLLLSSLYAPHFLNVHFFYRHNPPPPPTPTTTHTLSCSTRYTCLYTFILIMSSKSSHIQQKPDHEVFERKTMQKLKSALFNLFKAPVHFIVFPLNFHLWHISFVVFEPEFWLIKAAFTRLTIWDREDNSGPDVKSLIRPHQGLLLTNKKPGLCYLQATVTREFIQIECIQSMCTLVLYQHTFMYICAVRVNWWQLLCHFDGSPPPAPH